MWLVLAAIMAAIYVLFQTLPHLIARSAAS